MSSGAQNIKIRLDALITAENKSGNAKYENETQRPRNRQKRVWERKTCKWDTTPAELPKISQGAQNIKIGYDTKISHGARNMKTGPNALSTAENESGSATH
jgi:hypothetical protein